MPIKNRIEKKPIDQVKKTKKQVTVKDTQQSKADRTMETIAERASYYRANPQRFVEEFMGISLKLFQKILIYCMMHYDYFFFIASRGLGFEYLHLISASSCI